MTYSNENIGTLVWIITFRYEGMNQQQEVTRYTAESAYSFARGIQDNGGVAVVTESFEPSSANDEDFVPSGISGGKGNRSLIW